MSARTAQQQRYDLRNPIYERARHQPNRICTPGVGQGRKSMIRFLVPYAGAGARRTPLAPGSGLRADSRSMRTVVSEMSEATAM